MWFLWAERNRCRHNEAPFRWENVVWQVQMHIRKLSQNGHLTHTRRRGVQVHIPGIAAPARRGPAQRPLPVKWRPPDPPWLKLNTASWFSAASGQARGGGTVRDHRGQLILAFSVPLFASSALEASAKTLHIGLLEAKDLGTHIAAETDDQQVVGLTKEKSYGPAQSRQDLARLILLLKDCNSRISFVCSAKNKAAWCLARQESESMVIRRFDGHTAPRLLKAIIRLERLGVPYLDVEEEDDT